MTIDALEGEVFALEELLILLVVFDETTRGVDGFGSTAYMAFATLLGAAINLHGYTMRVADMVAAGSVAFLAADTWFGPCADEPFQVILVYVGRPGGISRGVARSAVIDLVSFSGVVSDPASVGADNIVGEVVLCGGILVGTGDDEAVKIDKTSLPVIAADHVGNLIPGIPVRWIGYFCERIFRRLTVDDLVQLIWVTGKHEHVVGFAMTLLAGWAADILGTNTTNRTDGSLWSFRSSGARGSCGSDRAFRSAGADR